MGKKDKPIEYAASFWSKDKSYDIRTQRMRTFKRTRIRMLLDEIQKNLEEIRADGKK